MSATPSATRVAVVVPVHRRHDHLHRLLASLRTGARVPDHVIVVAIDDDLGGALDDLGGAGDATGPAAGLRAELAHPTVTRRHLDAHPDGLGIARARNTGAAAALALGADVLVLLDVDLIAGHGLVAAYEAACREAPDVVWSGPVTYLDAGEESLDRARLEARDSPHPARPVPPPGRRAPMRDPDHFWSLSFACHASAWSRAGGFHEGYRGYGGEDTDFARVVGQAGLRLGWDGDARGFHQWHPTSDPPVQHLADILRNGRLYAERWGCWPMRGWLEQFAELGLVERVGDGWRATG